MWNEKINKISPTWTMMHIEGTVVHTTFFFQLISINFNFKDPPQRERERERLESAKPVSGQLFGI